MKMYHGTTEAAWAEIQAEGVLWGRDPRDGRDRVTWLALDKQGAMGWRPGPYVLLEVDMPEIKMRGYWQKTIYEPIPLARVRRIWEDVG